MPKRIFLPPALCEACKTKPSLGETLWDSGVAWICPACLTQQSEGDNNISKIAQQTLNADSQQSLSKRARAAGQIESATECEQQSNWHAQAALSIKDHANRQVQSIKISQGEIVSDEGNAWLKDTLSHPDLAALDASHLRGMLLESNDVTALGIDVSNTVKASNTAEKLISHQMALAHKIAFEQASKAHFDYDSAIQIKRLQLVTKMMKSSQEAATTLQKLKSAGTQHITVQHVHVESGGQAVVGNVQK